MIGNSRGFSLLELMITMAIFLFTIAAASQMFAAVLNQFKQQSKIAETNIEGLVGLELMRRDIAHAGYGLPWDINGATYSEADNSELIPAVTDQDDEAFNDAPSGAPRALVSGDGLGQDGSDVLVIKSSIVGRNEACEKWTHLFVNNKVTEWVPLNENLETSDRVIVLSPAMNSHKLVLSGSSFTARYDRNGTSPDNLTDSAFAPPDSSEARVVYGITESASPVTTPLRMPFNRADYYVRTPASNLPGRCASGTGVLYKGLLNQGTGATSGGGISELPIIDCVADMQALFSLDTNEDGVVDAVATDISGLSAAEIRGQVREVKVFILAQEGQIDRSFTFTNYSGTETCPTCIRVGESAVRGRDFDLSVVADYANYRWKVYALSVKTENLAD